MDSANKQSAVIAETVIGTTPATPAFKLLRDIRVSGAPNRSATRSQERRADRMAANMVAGLNSYPKVIELPWVRDAATDVLWESLLCGTFATNVLKNASTLKSFTLEEKYGGVSIYRRLTGAFCDSARISFQNGNAGSVSFTLKALAETASAAAIASATYVAPTPGNDPSSPADIVVNNLFGITTPKVMSMDMTISNSMRDQYKWGSADPFGEGLGLFDISGSVSFYFTALTDYNTFMTRQTGLTLDLTIGAVTLFKDQLQLGAVDAWNPNVDDPGATGDHMVTLNFMARYFATATAAITLTRNVA
jgi:hypothetical protein